MTERSKLIWVYLISTLFIAVNMYLVVHHFLWGAIAPVVLIILMLYFISIDKIIYLITFLTPLAINFKNMEMGLGVSLPTEPLMFGVLIFFVIKIFYDGKYEIRILRHPVTVFILLDILWLFFTSVTSQMPVVSFKFLLSRLWFLVPFYFLIILVFKKDVGRVKTFFWLYVISLIFVVVYTIIRHSAYGFDEDSGHWVVRPFYNDHTAYGAVLSMFIPVMLGLTFDRQYGISTRIISFSIFLLFVVALILSYSRAAWLSVGAVVIIWFIILLRIKFRWVLITTGVLIGLFLTFQQQIFDKLEKNKQDSSANFVEHVESITNISSDASNLERINRWQSALRMFDERPFWGWGPGTYQFLYAPFQRSKEKTIISTNAGDMGNAHSEYIGPLAESGIIGMITVFLIFISAVYIGLRVYKYAPNREIKIISLSVLLGLISYFLHGFLNNFLDTDKASVPVWGFIAILVTFDLYYIHKPDNKSIDRSIAKDE